ncbi:MAG: DNA replication complex GINS family protein [Methanomassiliicoccales archaeon]|nr:MAG: DNA replication complex GINS family protein [Methanomassiliicoccales archaeon]
MMAPSTERLTFREVSQISKKEENSSDLQEVRRDLYPAMREYIRKLKEDCDEEIKVDPLSIKATGLTNEYKKASQKAVIICQTRLRKIMLMAVRAGFGARVDVQRMTEEEKEFFESVLEEVKATKALAIEGQVIATRRTVPVSPCAVPLKEEVASSCPASIDRDADEKVQMVLIRMLEDIPPFKGNDRTYRLSKEDVVHLPAVFGCALVRSGKAIEIGQSKI